MSEPLWQFLRRDKRDLILTTKQILAGEPKRSASNAAENDAAENERARWMVLEDTYIPWA